MKKFLLILTVAIAVIAIALTVFIKIYVTPETVKAFVIPLAENALNRKVSVGDLEIGLIKGININDFVIKDIENKGDFARFKNLVLKFQLAPLLSKKIIIDELKLVSPEIHIVRNKDGSYNFDDIGKKTSGTPSGKTEVTESADAPLSLLISRIAVKSANFTLKDHMGELPEFKSLTDINLKMQSLSPDEVSASGEIIIQLDEIKMAGSSGKVLQDLASALSFNVRINSKKSLLKIETAELTLNKLSAKLKGLISDFNTNPIMDLSISMPSTDTKVLLGMIKPFADLKDLGISGNIAADLLVKGPSGKTDNLQTSGILTMTALDIKYGKYSVKLDGRSNLRHASDTLTIETQDLTVSDIPVNLSGKVKDLSKAPFLDLDLAIAKSSAVTIQKAAAGFADLKDLSLTGNLRADINVKGLTDKPDNIQALGSVFFDKLGITYKDLKATLDGDIKLKGKSIKLQASGQIAEKSRVDITDLSGGLTADITLQDYSKPLEKLNPSGTINLRRFVLKHQEIEALLDGQIILRDNAADLNITTTVAENTALLSGTVIDYMKNQQININITSKRLDIDKLLSITSSASTKGHTTKQDKSDSVQSSQSKKEPDPLDLKLSAKGEIKVDSALYKGLNMQDLHLIYSFKDNKLNITELSALAGKGKFNITGLINMSKPGYVYDLTGKIDSLHAEELVNSFFPAAKDSLFGILSMDLKISSAGTLLENIKKNLSANGVFNFTDGKITNAAIAENLALFFDVKDLKTLNLSKADGNIKIKDGLIHLTSAFVSDKIKMRPQGTIGLDESMKMAFDVILSPELTDKTRGNANIFKYMKDESGWGSIPIIIGGTLTNPTYEVDVAKAGQRVIEKEVDKFIDKLFKKNQSATPPANQPQATTELPAAEKSQEPAQQTPEDAIKNLLKGIFR